MPDHDDTTDPAPPTVTVPVRPPAGPFDAPDHLEVPVEAAGQWDARQWHDHPPV